MLTHLLNELQKQKTNEFFTYSIVISDNDHEQSAKDIVASFKKKSSVNIDYYCEPQQNIALARNKAVENAKGNFIALIDDDEFPGDSWLLILYEALRKFKADGVLGPVKPVFEEEPPEWILRGKFYEKPSHVSGFVLKWKDTRTSNVLLKSNVFNGNKNTFDGRFGSGGEDKEFFKRMIDKDYVFVWCNEAPVFEIIPRERCKRVFMLKRALLRGKTTLEYPDFGVLNVMKSVVAVPLYTLSLPVLIFVGHHIFMTYLVKDCDHIGKLLAMCGLDVVKEKYVLSDGEGSKYSHNS